MNINAISMLVRMYILRNIMQLQYAMIAFFWPVLQLTIFGCIGKSMVQTGVLKSPDLFVFGAILYDLIFRTAILLARNVYEEVVSKSLPNLFSSPFTLIEWILSVALYAAGMFIMLCVLLSSLSFMLFDFNVLVFGFTLFWFLPNLYCLALTLGFLGSCFIVRWGRRTVVYAFMLTATVLPLSGFFYDIRVMPIIVQYISAVLPSYYIALHGRHQLFYGAVSGYSSMITATILNVIYFTLSILAFVYMFNKTKKEKGLAAL